MKALITGASSGIGRELARLLARRCDCLVLVGRDKGRLEALRQELAPTPGLTVKAIRTDVSNPANCIRLYEAHPDVDLLVNNAGFGDFGEFRGTALEKELSMIDTNIKGLHTLMKLYLAEMTKRDSGHILNVASIAGFMPGPMMAAYYATKAYVVRLSEAVRTELQASGSAVRISLLCPGPVDTGFAKTANIPHFSGMDPQKTAAYALENLDRFYIVPGLHMRAARLIVKVLPTSLVSSAIYLIQGGRRETAEGEPAEA
jgi:hypothetical protein